MSQENEVKRESPLSRYMKANELRRNTITKTEQTAIPVVKFHNTFTYKPQVTTLYEFIQTIMYEPNFSQIFKKIEQIKSLDDSDLKEIAEEYNSFDKKEIINSIKKTELEGYILSGPKYKNTNIANIFNGIFIFDLDNVPQIGKEDDFNSYKSVLMDKFDWIIAIFKSASGNGFKIIGKTDYTPDLKCCESVNEANRYLNTVGKQHHYFQSNTFFRDEIKNVKVEHNAEYKANRLGIKLCYREMSDLIENALKEEFLTDIKIDKSCNSITKLTYISKDNDIQISGRNLVPYHFEHKITINEDIEKTVKNLSKQAIESTSQEYILDNSFALNLLYKYLKDKNTMDNYEDWIKMIMVCINSLNNIDDALEISKKFSQLSYKYNESDFLNVFTNLSTYNYSNLNIKTLIYDYELKYDFKLNTTIQQTKFENIEKEKVEIEYIKPEQIKIEKFNLLLGKCGTGKTTALVNHFQDNNMKFIIAMPNSLPVESLAKKFNLQSITGDTKQINQYANGYVAVYDSIYKIKNLKDYNIVLDEYTQLYNEFSFRSYNFRHVIDTIKNCKSITLCSGTELKNFDLSVISEEPLNVMDFMYIQKKQRNIKLVLGDDNKSTLDRLLDFTKLNVVYTNSKRQSESLIKLYKSKGKKCFHLNAESRIDRNNPVIAGIINGYMPEDLDIIFTTKTLLSAIDLYNTNINLIMMDNCSADDAIQFSGRFRADDSDLHFIIRKDREIKVLHNFDREKEQNKILGVLEPMRTLINLTRSYDLKELEKFNVEFRSKLYSFALIKKDKGFEINQLTIDALLTEKYNKISQSNLNLFFNDLREYGFNIYKDDDIIKKDKELIKEYKEYSKETKQHDLQESFDIISNCIYNNNLENIPLIERKESYTVNQKAKIKKEVETKIEELQNNRKEKDFEDKPLVDKINDESIVLVDKLVEIKYKMMNCTNSNIKKTLDLLYHAYQTIEIPSIVPNIFKNESLLKNHNTIEKTVDSFSLWKNHKIYGSYSDDTLTQIISKIDTEKYYTKKEILTLCNNKKGYLDLLKRIFIYQNKNIRTDKFNVERRYKFDFIINYHDLIDIQ